MAVRLRGRFQTKCNLKKTSTVDQAEDDGLGSTTTAGKADERLQQE